VVECAATERKDACVATDGRGDAIELHDRGMSATARGYVCEAHGTAADGARFVVRVVAPERAAGHAGISAETLGGAALRVARERAEGRLAERAFRDGEVYHYVVRNPFASPPGWSPVPS
jgi:hypothetical protein